MRPCFRTGRLEACPELLAAIPRPALVRAIVSHATTQPEHDGEPIKTTHVHEGRGFYLETPAERDRTIIRLV